MTKMWRFAVNGREVQGTTAHMVQALWASHMLDREFADCVDERFESASDLWGFLREGDRTARADVLVTENMDCIVRDVLASIAGYVDDCVTDRFENASGATVAVEAVEEDRIFDKE